MERVSIVQSSSAHNPIPCAVAVCSYSLLQFTWYRKHVTLQSKNRLNIDPLQTYYRPLSRPVVSTMHLQIMPLNLSKVAVLRSGIERTRGVLSRSLYMVLLSAFSSQQLSHGVQISWQLSGQFSQFRVIDRFQPLPSRCQALEYFQTQFKVDEKDGWLSGVCVFHTRLNQWNNSKNNKELKLLIYSHETWCLAFKQKIVCMLLIYCIPRGPLQGTVATGDLYSSIGLGTVATRLLYNVFNLRGFPESRTCN